MNQYDPGSQKERAEVMRNDWLVRKGEREPTTYAQLQAKGDAVLADIQAVLSPLQWPRLPSESPWAGDATGDTPPLGRQGR